jgi:hypothetical protein
MIQIPASIYADLKDTLNIRKLGDYVAFGGFFVVHNDFLKTTAKQAAMIEAHTKGADPKRNKAETVTLGKIIADECSRDLKSVEGTHKLQEQGNDDDGYSLARECMQLSTEWDNEAFGMNDEYFRAIVRKPNYYAWQALNDPLAPILVGTDARGRWGIVAVIMPMRLR